MLEPCSLPMPCGTRQWPPRTLVRIKPDEREPSCSGRRANAQCYPEAPAQREDENPTMLAENPRVGARGRHFGLSEMCFRPHWLDAGLSRSFHRRSLSPMVRAQVGEPRIQGVTSGGVAPSFYTEHRVYRDCRFWPPVIGSSGPLGIEVSPTRLATQALLVGTSPRSACLLALKTLRRSLAGWNRQIAAGTLR